MKKGLVIALLVVGAFFLVGGAEPQYGVEKHTHVVTEGQTVWSIAMKHKGESDRRMTLDEYVYYIHEANEWVKTPVIRPGDKIIIPVFKEVQQ